MHLEGIDAAVQTGVREIEMRSLDVEVDIGPTEGLLEVEGSGMCGSDYSQYEGEFDDMDLFEYPVIPGHEPVGRIAAIGEKARQAWGVEVGDRVAVENIATCGVCHHCTDGNYRVCENVYAHYGYTSMDVEHGLWGGYADYMVLAPNSRVHPLSEELSIEDAVLFNPIGAGFDWAVRAGDIQAGDSVLVLGPGQRGLACVVAALEAGADEVFVTGLEQDAHKLALAEEFGATATIDVEQTDVVERVSELTDGDLVDLAVDTTPHAVEPVVQAVNAVRPGGRIVAGGMKGMREVPLVIDELVLGDKSLRGVRGVRAWSFERAIQLVESGDYPLEQLHTHTFEKSELDRAMRVLAGDVSGEQAIHVTVA